MNAQFTTLNIVRLMADGQFYSGEQLGRLFGMSRVAVYKHIQTIRGWGIDVCAVKGRGYRFLKPLDLLDEAILAVSLPHHPIHLIPIIGSTNQYLLDRIPHLKSGEICLSEYQTSGRGRRGRRWFSPFGVNIYYSMYWRLQPTVPVTGLSLVIGLVVAQLLQASGAQDIKVKWPNDIYCQGKKLAGILVELNGASRAGMNVVMGIGINLAMQQVDSDIVSQAWTSLHHLNIARNTLVVELTQRLVTALTLFESQGLAPFLPIWSAFDLYMNQPVKLILGNETIRGILRGIDENGALLLEQNGQVSAFMSGDVSLRADQ